MSSDRCRTIVSFNQSGGVGKSTLTMNLGYHLAQRGHRVLLVDMDPQASLTVFMGLEPGELEVSIADALLRNAALPVHQGLYGMDLIPSNIALSTAEVTLNVEQQGEWRLRKALDDLQTGYDFRLIDAPPSLGILSVSGLVAADYVLVPIQTQYKSYKGTELLLDSISQVRIHAHQRLAIAGFVPMMFAASNAQDKSILSAIQEQLQAIAPVYSPIPRATAFADASMEGKPLALFNQRHPAVQVLEEIVSGLEDLG